MLSGEATHFASHKLKESFRVRIKLTEGYIFQAIPGAVHDCQALGSNELLVLARHACFAHGAQDHAREVYPQAQLLDNLSGSGQIWGEMQPDKLDTVLANNRHYQS